MHVLFKFTEENPAPLLASLLGEKGQYVAGFLTLRKLPRKGCIVDVSVDIDPFTGTLNAIKEAVEKEVSKFLLDQVWVAEFSFKRKKVGKTETVRIFIYNDYYDTEREYTTEVYSLRVLGVKIGDYIVAKSPKGYVVLKRNMGDKFSSMCGSISDVDRALAEKGFAEVIE